ncbi:histone deacetylase family protein [Methanocrinis sp.]|uniref:histone deacetylase family protein n=1 Tax=Methanocrinis sp. TaxID=3101522 RepID=UPI003D1369DD
MKIVYSKKFEERYHTNPVENPDRARLAAEELKGREFVEPSPATLEDVLRVHSRGHIEMVRRRGMEKPALLAAGGASLAAELALAGEPAFALIRPPGHHASSDHAWGMCYFNNMAVAVRKIEEEAGKVLVIDIDLHYGDGTVSIFRWDDKVKTVNIGAIEMGFDYLNLDSAGYVDQVERAVDAHNFDLVAVSAGFDTYVKDWGGLLDLDDYREIGRIIREGAEEKGRGRRFAVLEGGYHPDLGLCVKNFVEGFE